MKGRGERNARARGIKATEAGAEGEERFGSGPAMACRVWSCAVCRCACFLWWTAGEFRGLTFSYTAVFLGYQDEDACDMGSHLGQDRDRYGPSRHTEPDGHVIGT